MNNLTRRLAAGSSSCVARLRQPSSSLIWSRKVHIRKDLPYPVEQGLGDFLPPASLKMIAVDYQQGLLDRLNDEVRGTNLQDMSVVHTVIDSATDPSKALVFDYASEALNNSFFLEGLKPLQNGESSHESEINSDLSYRIKADFGTFQQLKSQFGGTAKGMFASGWLWLVTDQMGHLAVYPTFGTGTLLVRSRRAVYSDKTATHIKKGGEVPEPTSNSSPHPPPAPTSPTSGVSHSLPSLNPHTPSRTFSTSLATQFADQPQSIYSTPTSSTTRSPTDITRIGERLAPLLCLSLREHAWISAGYGVWGKEEYVTRFWSYVDWAAVSQAYNKFVPLNMRGQAKFGRDA